ncbi:MAG: hypothetical protein M1814_005863 [Vezdaea aestivalis]|nr:MAG: hypothetical protein M1814_005863 [Vezdaea aestivalis]
MPYCATYHFSEGQSLLSCAARPASYSVEYVSDHKFQIHTTTLASTPILDPTSLTASSHQNASSEGNGTLSGPQRPPKFNLNTSVNGRPLDHSKLPAKITAKSLWEKVRGALLRVADLIGKKIDDSAVSPEPSNSVLSYNATGDATPTKPYNTYGSSPIFSNHTGTAATKTLVAKPNVYSYLPSWNSTHQYASRSRVNISMNISSTMDVSLATQISSIRLVYTTAKSPNSTSILAALSSPTSILHRFQNMTIGNVSFIRNETFVQNSSTSAPTSRKTSSIRTNTPKKSTSGDESSAAVAEDVKDVNEAHKEANLRSKTTISSFDGPDAGYADWISVGGGETHFKVDGKSHDFPKRPKFGMSSGSVAWHNSWNTNDWMYDDDE